MQPLMHWLELTKIMSLISVYINYFGIDNKLLQYTSHMALFLVGWMFDLSIDCNV